MARQYNSNPYDARSYKRAGKRKRFGRRIRVIDMLLLAVFGLAGISWVGEKLSGDDSLEASPSRKVYFRYCSDARAAGVAPIHRGEPGYRSALDADGDGVACEPYHGD